MPETSRVSSLSQPVLALGFVLVFSGISAPAVIAGGMDYTALAATGVLGAALTALSVIDAQTFRLPDALTLPLVVLGIGFAYLADWEPSPFHRLIAAGGAFLALVAIDAAYFAWRQRSGLGLGDAKLFAAGAAWLGAGGLVTVLLYASLAGLLFALVLSIIGKDVHGRTAIPFGPFLALAIWSVWLYGPVG